MRKLMLFVCSICICILSSFSSVFAFEEYIGTFDNEEYPIVMLNPYISTLAESDNFVFYTQQYNYTTKQYDSYVDYTYAIDYSARMFVTGIILPSLIPAHTTFDFEVTLDTIGCGHLSDVFQITFYDENSNASYIINNPDRYSQVYGKDSEACTVRIEDVTADFAISKVGVFHRIRAIDESLMVGNIVSDVNCTLFNKSTQLNTIIEFLKNIPNSIANSFNSFFHSDDPIVNESETLNNELSNSINNYNDIESGLTDNLQNNINNLDTTVDLFNVSDFNATSIFLSQQLTNIFNINENIRNMIMYSLIMGFSLVLIGIGVKR